LVSLWLSPHAPLADGFIEREHAAVTEELFDIPEAQAGTKGPPDRVADDFRGNQWFL
jgi:hypothetical protein